MKPEEAKRLEETTRQNLKVLLNTCEGSIIKIISDCYESGYRAGMADAKIIMKAG